MSGAEDGDSGVSEMVGEAGDERRLGPDHDQIELELTGQPEQSLSVLGADGMAVAERRHPGVSGRRMQLIELGALGDLPGERVLASARSDDQDLHVSDSNGV